MRISEWHEKLTDGVGKCSVPMWCMGLPDGFCDEPAYGPQSPDSTYRGYVPALACPTHGGPDKGIVFKRDGNQWCATGPDFTNLAECPAGFGITTHDAARDLLRQAATEREGKGAPK